MESLFLSHSHSDHKLAGAIKQLVESCFAGQIEVRASSAAPSEGGIASGSEWLEWIREQVQVSKFTIVLLTPNSIDKPWLMWEAGAVAGVSMATREPSSIIPVVFRLSMEQVPSPLRSRQAARGEDRESIHRVLQTLHKATVVPESIFANSVNVLLPVYLQNAAVALQTTPPPLTESAVHDWLDRITYFETTNRRSEIAQFHRAMVNVFAPGDNAFDTPLDVRLHRRLGDIYLFAKNSEAAAKQYELALKLSSRDVFLMHKRGLALLEAGDEINAKAMLDGLLQIDPDAARSSTEIAGMKGRLFWQRYQRHQSPADLLAARDAYAGGLAANPDSHYMADNVGQLSLLLGEPEVARQAFEKGLAALEKTGDKGYWAIATQASCLLGLGRRKEGLDTLRRVPGLHPEPAATDSIRRGLKRLHSGLGLPKEELDAWLAILAGE